MKEESKDMNPLNEVRHHLYQIKIMLLILITLYVLGSYAAFRSMWDDIDGIVTRICEIIMVPAILIAPVILFFWIKAMSHPPRTNTNIEKEL